MKVKFIWSIIFFSIIVWFSIITSINLNALRIKDIATIDIPDSGPITNQVIGYGIVSGLNNTGDNMQNSMTTQTIINMLQRFGVTVPATNPRVRNVAAVIVTTTVPQYLKRGSKIDVNISAIGNAKSLQGGVLLMCPITDQNGDIVGMAQGPLTVGGYDYEHYGARVRKNETTTGRVANGLILEKAINNNIQYGNTFHINLNEPDYTRANTIKQYIGDNATIIDAGTVEVTVTDDIPTPQYIAEIEAMQIDESDNLPTARVVINERTGTIVIGGNVEITPIVISHGGLEIVIDKYYSNHRPYNHSYGYYGYGYGNYNRNAAYPFNGGLRMPKPAWNYMDTTIKYDIRAIEDYQAPHSLEYDGNSVDALVEGLRTMFVKPRDLISIFQTLKAAGALKAELIVQ